MSERITPEMLRADSIRRARERMAELEAAIRGVNAVASTPHTKAPFDEAHARQKTAAKALREDAPTLVSDLLEEVDALEEQLASAARERDETRALNAQFEGILRSARLRSVSDSELASELRSIVSERDAADQHARDLADPSRAVMEGSPCPACGRPCWKSSTFFRLYCREFCIGIDCRTLVAEVPR